MPTNTGRGKRSEFVPWVGKMPWRRHGQPAPGFLGFPGGSDDKESARNAGDLGPIPGFNPWVGKIPWKRERLPAPVFLPGETHGQRSLVGYVYGVTDNQTQPK